MKILLGSLRWLLSVAFSAVGLRAAEAPDRVVQMSPFEVTADTIAFEKWIKVGSPHFTVYSDAALGEVSAVVREMEMMHLAAEHFFRRPALKLRPTIVVLPTSRSDWRRVESRGLKVEWNVAVSSTEGRAVDLITVQYDWQRAQGRDVFRGALGRAEMRALNLRGPLWFRRGTSAFFQTAKFTEDSVTLGEPHPRARALGLRGWLPWSRFFAVTPDSPEYTKSGEFARFEGQCVAFAQYLLTHPDPAWTDRLLRWAALLDAGCAPTEEEFRGVFGMDWTAWQQVMDEHRADRSAQGTKIRLSSAELAFPLTRFDLPVREMRELFVLSQILNQRVPESDAALDALLARGLKTEALREVLVEACLARKRRIEAMDQLRVLIAAEAKSPLVYALAAEQTFRAAVPEVTLWTRLASEQSEIRQWCRLALAREPLLPSANTVLAWTEALGPEVTDENVAAIETIYHTLAGNSSTIEVVSAWAVARWRAGQIYAARALATQLRDSPFADKRARALAEALLPELDRAR